jgi:hypothetical protein
MLSWGRTGSGPGIQENADSPPNEQRKSQANHGMTASPRNSQIEVAAGLAQCRAIDNANNVPAKFGVAPSGVLNRHRPVIDQGPKTALPGN